MIECYEVTVVLYVPAAVFDEEAFKEEVESKLGVDVIEIEVEEA